jgi:UDP-glucuronate decarboxylase
MRILVTGGAGFIGSHLCERLLGLGHEVVCLDNYFTGSKRNLGRLLDHRRFELMRHDIIHYIDIESDQIYNLACPASPVHYQRDAIRTVHANVLGVTNMLELARRTGARILQASTSEVYGNPEIHPQPESYWGNVNPIGVRSCYDEGKRVAETLLMDYHRKHQVDIRIARIFNTYGPRMAIQDGRVVSSFVVQSLLGEPLTVFGDGSQTRSFCYVSDLIEGLMALMNREDVTGPVNLGNPEEVTIRQVAELVLELTRSPVSIEPQPIPEDDPVRRQPDITLARTLLGWSPRISLRDGLAPTIEYFRRVLEGNRSEGIASAVEERLQRQFVLPLPGDGSDNGNGDGNGSGGGNGRGDGGGNGARAPLGKREVEP